MTMRRFAAFDPPEYVSWSPDPDVMQAYAALISANNPRAELMRSCSDEQLKALYSGLVKARLHDIALKRWVKQGVISKAWLATGEEASTIGVVQALNPDDVVAPMIRNASACIEKGIPLTAMFSAYLATTQNPTQGRDLLIGSIAHNVITPISHVAANVSVCAGVALAFKLNHQNRISVCWTGDGSTRCGEFHEGVSLAAALQLPIIFCVQNNQVALGTRAHSHSRTDFATLGHAYGIPTLLADGNHVLDVWAATRQARAISSNGDGPVILVLNTFRMGGHATHDEAEARKLFPPEIFKLWGQRDPIGCFASWLSSLSPSWPSSLSSLEQAASFDIDHAASQALDHRQASQPSPASALLGVFAPQ